MHFMTDRSSTLLFNFQTQNIVSCGIGHAADGSPAKRCKVSYAPERGFINRKLNM